MFTGFLNSSLFFKTSTEDSTFRSFDTVSNFWHGLKENVFKKNKSDALDPSKHPTINLQNEEISAKLIAYLKTIKGQTEAKTYNKLLSIDPKLVGEARYKETDWKIIKLIKSLYYRFIRLSYKTSTIEKFQKRLVIIKKVKQLRQDSKETIKLYNQHFKTKFKFLSGIQADLNSSTRASSSKLSSFLSKLVTSCKHAHLLLDPQLLHTINSVISEASHFDNTSLGLASFIPDYHTESSTVKFSSKQNLKSTVPFTTGMIDDSKKHMLKWRHVGVSENIKLFPTKHCGHTHKLRKELIAKAEHNILISGNYCGGKAFDEILELIRDQLRKKPELQVVIISSTKFIKDSTNQKFKNKTLIQELRTEFPQRFSLIPTQIVKVQNPTDTTKTSDNHTKYFGIDWGRHSIIGGSAIKDNFVLSGVDNPLKLLGTELKNTFSDLLSELKSFYSKPSSLNRDSRKAWVENTKKFVATLKEAEHHSQSEFDPLIEAINNHCAILEDENPLKDTPSSESIDLLSSFQGSDNLDEGIAGMFIPGNFRDMDFLFSDPNDGYSSGRQSFLEMVRLAYRWEALNEARKKNPTIPFYTPEEVSNLPIFTTEPGSPPSLGQSVTQKIMSKPMPCMSEIKTSNLDLLDNVPSQNIEMFFQGPESPTGKSSIASQILEHIENANEQIIFNHMYFAPTKKILEALKQAIERGVKVKIITAAETKNCPNGQKIFGVYNKWHWSHLASMISPENQHLLDIYNYNQKKKGLHKKVILIDDTIISGSSNFGYKSLVTSSDHEINFISNSKYLAKKVLEVFDEDISHSIKVETPTSISLSEVLRAALYDNFKHHIN